MGSRDIPPEIRLASTLLQDQKCKWFYEKKKKKKKKKTESRRGTIQSPTVHHQRILYSGNSVVFVLPRHLHVSTKLWQRPDLNNF